MKILIIGSGGREHALAWKCAQSELVDTVYVAPGNGGTALEEKCENVDIQANNTNTLINFAYNNNIELVIVGPEQPLVDGIVDASKAVGISIIGPYRAAAQLEGSKIYAKNFMKKHGIPTAKFEYTSDIDKAKYHIDSMIIATRGGCVVKADGLAAGKGAIVCDSSLEAKEAAEWLLHDRPFGSACDCILIEERLYGREMSFMAFVSGYDVSLFPTSCDYKRLLDADVGPNTGGMGAYSPSQGVFINRGEEEILEQIMGKFYTPTIMGLACTGDLYTGFLYCGVLFAENEYGYQPYLLEYNVRLGDPETQVLLPRMESDLVRVLTGRDDKISWSDDTTVGLVLASEGYPKDYKKGEFINGILSETRKNETSPRHQVEDYYNTKVFHAGTQYTGDDIITNGGRVFTVVGKAHNLDSARQLAYTRAETIRWPSKTYRTDIGIK